MLRYLTKEHVLRNFNPQDLTNTTWGFCKVGYVNHEAMEMLARECHRKRSSFDPRLHLNKEGFKIY